MIPFTKEMKLFCQLMEFKNIQGVHLVNELQYIPAKGLGARRGWCNMRSFPRNARSRRNHGEADPFELLTRVAPTDTNTDTDTDTDTNTMWSIIQYQKTNYAARWCMNQKNNAENTGRQNPLVTLIPAHISEPQTRWKGTIYTLGRNYNTRYLITLQNQLGITCIQKTSDACWNNWQEKKVHNQG